MLSGTATARNTRLAEFTESQKIGEGTYGQVYKARDTSGEWVALKKLRLDDNGEGVPVTTLREVALLKELVHDNIVRLRDVVAAPPKLYLVFDYHEQDLKQCMDKHFRDGMPGTLIKTCIMQILRGVAYCHSKRVLHRDLKPQNVLIDVSGRVKLADFGLARVLQNLNPQHYTHEVVTLWYRAPELLLGKREYSMSVDTWSIGCIFAELCCRKPLFPGDSEIDQLFRIFRCLGTPTEDLWPGCTQLPNFQECFPKWTPKRMREEVPNIEEGGADLLAHLVIYTAERRVNARDALQHPYFDEVRALPDTALPRLSDFFGSPDHVSPSSVTAASLASANAAGDAPAPPEAVDPPPEAVSLSEAKPDSLLADETLTSSSGDGSAHAVKQMKKRKRTLRAS
jgi:serine/threonine protein kinase